MMSTVSNASQPLVIASRNVAPSNLVARRCALLAVGIIASLGLTVFAVLLGTGHAGFLHCSTAFVPLFGVGAGASLVAAQFANKFFKQSSNFEHKFDVEDFEELDVLDDLELLVEFNGSDDDSLVYSSSDSDPDSGSSYFGSEEGDSPLDSVCGFPGSDSDNREIVKDDRKVSWDPVISIREFELDKKTGSLKSYCDRTEEEAFSVERSMKASASDWIWKRQLELEDREAATELQ